ncbi:MAG: OTU-like cysteine protease [Gammaproteobacteria bacterium]|jgi:hypothetical protein|nr:OTU-like cysteine protease [Gammaproteobacteria bacterium]
MPNLEKIRAIQQLQEELKAQESTKNLQAFQKRAAKLLRQWAIEHLANGCGNAGQLFQRLDDVEITPGRRVSKQEYLAYMAQDGSWGTDLEARALSEVLGLPLITYLKNDSDTWTDAFHDARKATPETIKLYYHTVDDSGKACSAHWNLSHNYQDDILLDNNCLFNAFALEVARVAPLLQAASTAHAEQRTPRQLPKAGVVITPAQAPARSASAAPVAVTAPSSIAPTVSKSAAPVKPVPTPPALATSTVTVKEPINIVRVVESQKQELARIQSAFFKLKPSAQQATSASDEPCYTRLKTTEELEQIRKDYELALKLAAEELQPRSRL